MKLLAWLTGPLVLASLCSLAFVAGATPDDVSLDRFGVPAVGTQFERNGYVLWYDSGRRSPRFVLEQFTAESLAYKVDRYKLSFVEDRQIPALWRTHAADYDKSGFDIGHMRPADDSGSLDELRDTFLFSNACPQLPNFNRGRWSQLEANVRAVALNPGVQGVWVVTGPLWMRSENDPPQQYVGKSRIPVASHFYKSAVWLLGNGSVGVNTWIVPHRDNPPPLDQCRVSVDQLERACGFDVWDLPDSQEAQP